MRRAGRLALVLPILAIGAWLEPAGAAPRTARKSAAPAAATTAAAPAPAAAPLDTAGTAHVTSQSGTTIYVDAGSKDGLAVGQTVTVHRDGHPIGLLRVDYLASHRAACTSTSGEPPRAGDRATFTPAPREVAAGPAVGPAGATGGGAAAGTPPRRRGNWFRRAGIRGRAGVRLLTVQDRGAGGAGFRQPSLDLRLEGTRVGGSDFDLSVDARTRRTWRASATTQDPALTRVYRLSLARQSAGSPLRIAAGRLASPSLASVNLFDGVLTEYAGPRFGAGFFAGSQPGTSDWAYTRQIMEYGGYARLQNALLAPHRWSITGGGVTSYNHGATNRDYVFLRGQWNDARSFGYLSQEIDVNRGWRREIESGALSLTSTLLSLQYRPTNALTLNAGYDNRRNVRLYDDRETPESEFDAAHRQGWSGGISLYPTHALSFSGDRRVNGGGADRTDATTGSWRVTHLPGVALDLSGRHTRYHNPQSAGWLHAWSMGGGLGAGRRLEAHTGLRDERSEGATRTRTYTRWYGLNLDVGLARSIYLLLSGEATRGDLENNDQYYLSLSYQL